MLHQEFDHGFDLLRGEQVAQRWHQARSIAIRSDWLKATDAAIPRAPNPDFDPVVHEAALQAAAMR